MEWHKDAEFGGAGAALALPVLLCPPAAGGQGPGGRYNHGNWDYPGKLLPLLQRQGQNKQKLSIFLFLIKCRNVLLTR